MTVRPQHLEDAAKSYKEGTLSMAIIDLLVSGNPLLRPSRTVCPPVVEGGGTFSSDQALEDGKAKVNGSWMFFHAENMEKAREWLENDVRLPSSLLHRTVPLHACWLTQLIPVRILRPRSTRKVELGTHRSSRYSVCLGPSTSRVRRSSVAVRGARISFPIEPCRSQS